MIGVELDIAIMDADGVEPPSGGGSEQGVRRVRLMFGAVLSTANLNPQFGLRELRLDKEPRRWDRRDTLISPTGSHLTPRCTWWSRLPRPPSGRNCADTTILSKSTGRLRNPESLS